MKRTLNDSVSRRKFLITTAIATATCGLGLKSCAHPVKKQGLARLEDVGNDFTFALIADPQIEGQATQNPVPNTSERKLSAIIQELNELQPRLPFVVFNGDMTNSVKAVQIKNFLHRTKLLHALPVLVHGNHDGYFPYAEFKQIQKTCNGSEETMFSFNCGRWHFVTFPCNFEENKDFAAGLLNWLDTDLRANRNRPTIVFEHYHLLPQGLTQLAWYTYEKPLKQQIIEQLAKYDNVRYVICGHVHNGIQTSVKTAWTYQGINFITAPTCTTARNFGEEYSQFRSGLVQDAADMGGGYYLLIDIKGETAQIRGRLAEQPQEYLYPSQFTPYQDQEPLWFKNVTDYPPNPALINPSFDTGLAGWMQPYRYHTDQDPSYVAKAVNAPTAGNGQSAYLFCREKGQAWAHDELMELYQMVQMPGKSAVFTAHYYPEASLKNGGGYFRLCAYKGNQLKLIVLLDWSDGHKSDSVSVSQNSLYMATGLEGESSLKREGEKKQALFWQLPATLGRWHKVQVALDSFYDRAVQQQGAFAQLGIDRMLVAVGVWCLPDQSSQSGAFFDQLSLESNPAKAALMIDDVDMATTDQNVFQTDFAEELAPKTAHKKIYAD